MAGRARVATTFSTPRLSHPIVGGCVATNLDLYVCTDRTGAVNLFALPTLCWVVCVAPPLPLGPPPLRPTIHDAEPFVPSPACLVEWDEPGGQLVLSAEADGSVRVWHLPSLLLEADEAAEVNEANEDVAAAITRGADDSPGVFPPPLEAEAAKAQLKLLHPLT